MVRVDNKRRHARYDGRGLWARVKIDGILSEAEVENVSLGGVLVRLRFPCPHGKNLLLELRGTHRDLRLVGRVVGTAPRGHRSLPGTRVRFDAPTQTTLDHLLAMIRGLPTEDTVSSRATQPEAYAFHDIHFDEHDFDILEDVGGEPPGATLTD